jgi:integrase
VSLQTLEVSQMQIKSYYNYTQKGTPYYFCRLTYKNGEYKTISTKETAEYKVRAFSITEMNKRNEEDREKQREELFKIINITLKDYARDFFSLSGKHIEKKKAFNPSINDRWIFEKQAIVKNHILPSSLAEKYLREITEDDIEIFVVKLTALNPVNKLSANSKNKILMMLKIILKEAYKEKKLDRILVFDIRIQGIKKKDILKIEEIKKLFPENWEPMYPNPLYVINLIACTTGMRSSEILGLQIKHIDFTNKSIRINQSRDNKLQMLNSTPKNKKSREVVIFDKVLNEIRYLIEENPKPENMNSFLFYGEAKGKPVDQKFLPRHFFNALKKANIDLTERTISFHAIRHSINTHLLIAGINQLKIKRFLGHSDKSDDITALHAVILKN